MQSCQKRSWFQKRLRLPINLVTSGTIQLMAYSLVAWVIQGMCQLPPSYIGIIILRNIYISYFTNLENPCNLGGFPFQQKNYQPSGSQIHPPVVPSNGSIRSPPSNWSPLSCHLNLQTRGVLKIAPQKVTRKAMPRLWWWKQQFPMRGSMGWLVYLPIHENIYTNI